MICGSFTAKGEWFLLLFRCMLMDVCECHIWYPDMVYAMVKCKTCLDSDTDDFRKQVMGMN